MGDHEGYVTTLSYRDVPLTKLTVTRSRFAAKSECILRHSKRKPFNATQKNCNPEM